jgi:hypothetical protein
LFEEPTKDHPVWFDTVLVTYEHPEVASPDSVLAITRKAPQGVVDLFRSGRIIQQFLGFGERIDVGVVKPFGVLPDDLGL